VKLTCDCGCGRRFVVRTADGQQFHSPVCLRAFYGGSLWRPNAVVVNVVQADGVSAETSGAFGSAQRPVSTPTGEGPKTTVTPESFS
jgi:hypothetical protein